MEYKNFMRKLEEAAMFNSSIRYPVELFKNLINAEQITYFYPKNINNDVSLKDIEVVIFEKKEIIIVGFEDEGIQLIHKNLSDITKTTYESYTVTRSKLTLDFNDGFKVELDSRNDDGRYPKDTAEIINAIYQFIRRK